MYKGAYTASSLRPTCLPWEQTTFVFGTSTTQTKTVTDGVRITKSTPAVKTKTKYAKTITSTEYEYRLPSTATSTSTSTVEGQCTKTITTGTAKATATYAAKCKPSNLITGSDPHGFSDNAPKYDGKSNKDASACCQACVDAKDCSASWFRRYMNEDECIFYGRGQDKPTCDVAYAVRAPNSLTEDSGARGQVGCGSVLFQLN